MPALREQTVETAGDTVEPGKIQWEPENGEHSSEMVGEFRHSNIEHVNKIAHLQGSTLGG